MADPITDQERIARGLTVCPACAEDKQPGALVCSRCFKSEAPHGLPALKWSRLSFSAWLGQVRQMHQTATACQTSR